MNWYLRDMRNVRRVHYGAALLAAALIVLCIVTDTPRSVVVYFGVTIPINLALPSLISLAFAAGRKRQERRLDA